MLPTNNEITFRVEVDESHISDKVRVIENATKQWQDESHQVTVRPVCQPSHSSFKEATSPTLRVEEELLVFGGDGQKEFAVVLQQLRHEGVACSSHICPQ